ncbi:hypothetical protein [methane-oxidizing endosymbiont of Gigantopelta aegis]|uniref:hypothetical protein n=1 Tax=methane-oxidizing endosymbiont of Gigantopelta aegis TaxID=2794938 RepID=UPI0018DC4616|nr:hypothetical protein [methane-oxidizing endosymbiont of Gigantopelta aegis]
MKQLIMMLAVMLAASNVWAVEGESSPSDTQQIMRQHMLEMRKQQREIRAKIRAEQVAAQLKQEVERKAAMRRGEAVE